MFKINRQTPSGTIVEDCHIAFINVNREINTKHVLELVLSIKKYGFFPSELIGYATIEQADNEELEYKYLKTVAKDSKGKLTLEFYDNIPKDATPNNTRVISSGQHRTIASFVADTIPLFAPIGDGIPLLTYTALTGNLTEPWKPIDGLKSIGSRSKGNLLKDIENAVRGLDKGAHLALLDICAMDAEKGIGIKKLKEATANPALDIDKFIKEEAKLNKTNVAAGIEIYTLIKGLNYKDNKLLTSSRLSKAMKATFNKIRDGRDNSVVYDFYMWLFGGGIESKKFVDRIYGLKSRKKEDYINALLDAVVQYEKEKAEVIEAEIE